MLRIIGGETIFTEIKMKKNVLSSRVGLDEKWIYSSMRNILMEGKVSSSLGTNNAEGSTKKRCCRNLHINRNQRQCVKNLTSPYHQSDIFTKRYVSDNY